MHHQNKPSLAQHLEIVVLGAILVALLAIMAQHPFLTDSSQPLSVDAAELEVSYVKNPTLRLEAPEIGH